MEEGTELLNRLNDKNAVLPMFTSCCPAWINFVELHKARADSSYFNYPFSAGGNGFFNQELASRKKKVFQKEKIRSISIMPCTAKKDEAARQALAKDAVPDVDLVLTVREFAKLLKGKGIDLRKLEGQDFDTPFMSKGSGAAVIFGKTGVAEAAARTVYYVLTGKNVNSIQFKTSEHPHVEQELTIDLGEGKSPLRIGVVHGLANADLYCG